MPPVPRRAKRPAWVWARWIFLGIATISLGYVAYAYADAELFQAYENWQFDRAAHDAHPRPAAITTKPLVVPASLSDPSQRATVAPGAVLGRLEISRIGVSVIVAEGVDSHTLRRAVGHIPGTAFPGEHGNVAISGHRDTFFRALKDIQQDDEITLTTLEGSYRYRVDLLKVVSEDEMSVLKGSSESILTLVTCYPFYFVGPAPKRFVVRAHRT
jgi:sortase A